MIKLEFNGRPFNPKTFEKQILRAAMEQVANEMHERVSSIRHPSTGEFPTVVVNGSSLEDMSMRIEGSPELLQLVNERLGVTAVGDSGNALPSIGAQPKVFLSWAWEDRALADPIANALMEKGVDTWWSEWCISAGDSLRQKIDEGLNDCTHFVVLLTPQSIKKPWVNKKIDAGFALMLSQRKVKFIALRHGLPVGELPPLMRGMLSPEVSGPEHDLWMESLSQADDRRRLLIAKTFREVVPFAKSLDDLGAPLSIHRAPIDVLLLITEEHHLTTFFQENGSQQPYPFRCSGLIKIDSPIGC